MPLKAFIFDLDGTLIDSNARHSRAWKSTLHRHGYTDITEERIAIEIGKGGDRLVPILIGEVDDAFSKELRDTADEFYRNLVQAEGTNAFPRVRDLFDALRERGFRIAVATASEKENLKALAERTGIDVFELAEEVVTSTDVEESKPEPDTILAAVKKLGLKPKECVMVGDTIYDVESSKRGGVPCIGLLTGVWTGPDMVRAGAVTTYRNTADLLEHLEEAIQLVKDSLG